MLEEIQERILSDLEVSQPEWIIYFPKRWQAETFAQTVYDYIETHYQKQTVSSCSSIPPCPYGQWAFIYAQGAICLVLE